MGKWRDVFCSSPNFESPDSCFFNPPATEAELQRIEAEFDVRLPSDLREMLLEFNGIDKMEYGRRAPFILGTNHMKLPEFYIDWDVPTDNLIEWSRNVFYVRQFNSFTYLWGVVVKPFAEFGIGDIIEFDHDEIEDANEPEELFMNRLKSLNELLCD
jgi:hypothetical protein